MIDPWRRLAFYESADFVEEVYLKRHSISTRQTHAKASEIATNLAQGRQYFEAARLAGELSKPLLVYYGVLSLTRALILFLDRSKRETNLLRSHGVEISGWENFGSAASPSASSIDSVSLWTRRGTLSELRRATENMRRAFLPTSFEQEGLFLRKSGTSLLPGDLELKLKDLLARVPQLDTVYEMVFEELPSSFQVAVDSFHVSSDSNPLVLRLNGTKRSFPDHSEMARITGIPEALYQSTDQVDAMPGLSHHKFLFQATSLQELHESLPGISTIPVADSLTNRFTYILAALPRDIHLSLLTVSFLISYSVGMLVRYFPSTWTIMGRRASGDRIFPLLRAAIHFVESEFPRMVLEEFEDRPGVPDLIVPNPYRWIDAY